MADRHLSIRARLFILIGIASLATLVMLSYFALSERDERLEMASGDVNDFAQRITSEQKVVVNRAEQLVDLLARLRDMGKLHGSSDCHEVLRHFLQLDPRLANVALASTDGNVICNATSTATQVNIADRVYFRKALNEDNIVIGEAIFSRSNGKWSLPIARKMPGKNGQAQGVLVVALDLHWINRELAHVANKGLARIGLVSSRGIVLAQYPDPGGWITRDASKAIFFTDLIAHRGTGSIESTGLDGLPLIFGLSHFAETTEGPIYLWVGVSKEAVTGKIYRNFAWTLSVCIGVLAILFFIVWVGAERLVLRPVSIISNVARRLGKGDSQARTGLEYDDSEIGVLAQSVDKMAAALASNNEILRLNRALKLLSECNSALVRADDEDQLLSDICRLAVESGSYLMAWVGYAEHDEGKTVRPVTQFGYEEGYLDSISVTWADTPNGQGPTGTAIRTGIMSVNQDCLTNPKMLPWREAAIKRGYQASAAFPLIWNGRTFGALTLYASEPNAFNHDETTLLIELANDLAYGIQTLRARKEHIATEVQLEFLAHHDPLTRLPNRILVQDRFEQAAAHARREQLNVGMLYLDLDNFKQVNDTMGHELGDHLLLRVVERLKGCVRETDSISRQGGDEFIILLTGLSDLGAINTISQNIIDAFAEPIDVDGNTLAVSFSIGISIFPENGEDFMTLLKHADSALYRAKDAGRNTYRFFSQQMNADEMEEIHLQGGLRNAVKQQEFLLNYQPQVDADTGRIVGAEALVRWQHPEYGLISPAKFIPLAERSGLIIPLGEWILNEACKQAKVWQETYRDQHIVVAVNLSALQFKRGDILDTVSKALETSGLPANLLELELTESILLHDMDVVMETLLALREIGVNLSIDDFGTGYSSLAYLKRLSVNKLKIDRTFVRDMVTDPDDAAIVKSIIQLGHIMQLTVIAEGVESDAQLAMLKSYRCDEIQGYLFSRPLSANDFSMRVESETWSSQIAL